MNGFTMLIRIRHLMRMKRKRNASFGMENYEGGLTELEALALITPYNKAEAERKFRVINWRKRAATQRARASKRKRKETGYARRTR